MKQILEYVCEFRNPNKGERYLSGTNEQGLPDVWTAPNNLPCDFWVINEEESERLWDSVALEIHRSIARHRISKNAVWPVLQRASAIIRKRLKEQGAQNHERSSLQSL